MTYDFIIISTADWDHPFWTNKQHIAKRLADRGHRVLYIDSLGLRRPTAKQSDIKRIFKKISRFTNGLQEKYKNLWVWSPIVIPFHGNENIRNLNFKFLEIALKYFSKKLNFKNPILWIYNPLAQKLVGNLNEQFSVYHCVDELSAQPGMPIETLKYEEEMLLKKVNMVFATSPNLYETRKKYNSNTYYSPNVADYEHFHKAASCETEIPEDIKNIPGPRIGFIGAISGYKLNFNLIESVAKSSPDLSFVFIGQIGEGEPGTDIINLKSIKNIYFLGPKPYNDLPNYLKAFDVCLLPNNLNEYTKNMFPMKFFEYLSAGKPVVMTQLPALEEYYHLCYVANDSKSFCEMILKALQENNKLLIDKRIEEAKKHNWDSRIDTMLSLIEKSL
jgi:glycosyltransferase involved in cell wall biosynthesis